MRIADNQVALLAGWDNALVQSAIGDLRLKGYPLALLMDVQRVGELEALVADFKERAAIDDARDTRLFERVEKLGK